MHTSQCCSFGPAQNLYAFRLIHWLHQIQIILFAWIISTFVLDQIIASLHHVVILSVLHITRTPFLHNRSSLATTEQSFRITLKSYLLHDISIKSLHHCITSFGPEYNSYAFPFFHYQSSLATSMTNQCFTKMLKLLLDQITASVITLVTTLYRIVSYRIVSYRIVSYTAVVVFYILCSCQPRYR